MKHEPDSAGGKKGHSTLVEKYSVAIVFGACLADDILALFCS